MLSILAVETYTIGSKIILGIFFAVLLYIFIQFAVKMIEMGYVLRTKKPFFVHLYLSLKTLSINQKSILTKQFAFYNKLDTKHKKYFEHRVASFINDKDFIGRNGLEINDEIKVLISSTAVMLTFGFRDFYIGLINKIVIYPNKFYSRINKEYHKGEFNPKLKALVLSWEDFKLGYKTTNDNINLGIHEFVHAIHLNSLNERDISSTIFSDSFKELTELLSENKLLRDELVQSKYIRNYAFTNQFEFLAVVIESFIETPKEFKLHFPEVYFKIHQMLNFNFAGY
ncbi:zinc-dependent peptidase [Yeosuana marina]|mgnify:CR=1 FL=1|uniref:zinc-dependent peptidase n=1 Tax=Yeosuana marina TaxID=1565536 RepID=UPI00142289A6|nr:zinc-dependent peptidase [Yeosuana marina]|tara:strand:- start:519 stop:1370 length:852 start_codon:yes stop_codon:yes gene_type:complete